MMKVRLPISWVNDESQIKAVDAGINIPVTEADVKLVTFYRISAIWPYKDPKSGAKCTMILSDGEEFICTLPIGQVESKINQAQ